MSEEQQRLESVAGTPAEAAMVAGGSYKKTVLDKMTPAIIKGVSWEKKVGVKQDKVGNEYTQATIIATFQVDGYADAIMEFYNFSIYKNSDGTLRAYYGGENSICARLRLLTEKTFNLPNGATLADFLKVLEGKSVMLKTESNTYAGKTYLKQVVQQFRI